MYTGNSDHNSSEYLHFRGHHLSFTCFGRQDVAIQRTADCIVRILGNLSSANQFHHASLHNEERHAFEGCQALVRRLTVKIAEDGFV